MQVIHIHLLARLTRRGRVVNNESDEIMTVIGELHRVHSGGVGESERVGLSKRISISIRILALSSLLDHIYISHC